MKSYWPTGPYCEQRVTVTAGGGITTDQLLSVLKEMFLGEALVGSPVTEETYPAGEGPLRLVTCERWAFRSSPARGIPTMAEFLSKVQVSEMAPWEVALRAFLTNPFAAVAEGDEVLLHLDDSTKDQGHVIGISALGGRKSAPRIVQWPLDLYRPFRFSSFFVM